jgi:hypothetical protein
VAPTGGAAAAITRVIAESPPSLRNEGGKAVTGDSLTSMMKHSSAVENVHDCSQVCSLITLWFGDMTAKRIASALTQIVSIPLGLILGYQAFIYYISVMDWWRCDLRELIALTVVETIGIAVVSFVLLLANWYLIGWWD